MNFETYSSLDNVQVCFPTPLTQKILTPDCLKFIAVLHRLHNQTRLNLLKERVTKQQLYDQGMPLTYPPETEAIRNGNWQVAPVPKELQKRWIEITGPPSYKGSINALNCGADVFMADLEDATSPSWQNVIVGQDALLKANQKSLTFQQGERTYKLNEKIATLFLRPRGWHLDEKHMIIDGQFMSGSLFDFGVYFFHNVHVRQQMGLGGTFFYLPKLESYHEARLWNEVFNTAQMYMKVPVGTIRCTVLIETIEGGMQMDEILYELRDHIVALNAGRWDYLFSLIKKQKTDPTKTMPDRAQVGMAAPFMRAYTNRLVQLCHKRGAHAIGGMSAFIPSKSDKSVNEMAYSKIKEDKNREANDGFDGSWVAHPDMVKIAREIFEKHLGGKDHQKHVMRHDVNVLPKDLTTLELPGAKITENGVRMNINVCIQYVYYWLLGSGAVGLHNLMEDAATAEISRSQLWQWIKWGKRTDTNLLITKDLYRYFRDMEYNALKGKLTNKIVLERAVQITDDLVLDNNFAEFLTLPAYDILINLNRPKL